MFRSIFGKDKKVADSADIASGHALAAQLSEKLAQGLPSSVKAQGVQVEGGRALFSLVVSPDMGAQMEDIRQKAEMLARSVSGVEKVTAILTAERPADENAAQPQNQNSAGGCGSSAGKKPPEPLKEMPDVTHIIAVASGKGGVGKSTVALNLAVSLAAQGLRVGLMDADIYGPSMPRMSGLPNERPPLENGKLIPPQAHGVKVMSIGFLVEEDTPMIWRGPMIQSALRQFMEDVEWGSLDVMIVDMPPGTGDAQLTMAQKVPLAGAVIVSTPQDIALLDARKGIGMFEKTNVPVLGLIENMSVYCCPECGHEAHIFGHGGAEAEAQKRGVPFLGAIPLQLDIREASDAGKPYALSDGKAAQIYKDIAAQITETLQKSMAA